MTGIRKTYGRFWVVNGDVDHGVTMGVLKEFATSPTGMARSLLKGPTIAMICFCPIMLRILVVAADLLDELSV